MKKLSKMLICLVLCFMVTCLATNGATRIKTATSTKMYSSGASYYFNEKVTLNENRKMILHSESFVFNRGSAGLLTGFSYSHTKVICATYSDRYEFSCTGTITTDTIGSQPNSGYLFARVYR